MSDALDALIDSTPAKRPADELDSLIDSTPAAPSRGPVVSGAGALREGVGQGLTMGHGDELGAFVQAALAGLTPGMSMRDTYREARRDNRQVQEAAKTQHGGAFMAGNLAGSIIPQALATAATGGTSLGAQMALGAGQGALTGLGESDELDRKAVLNTVGGGLLGAGGAAVGHLGAKALGAGANAIGRFAKGRVGAAASRATDLAAGETADAIASARGAVGGETQKANRLLENLMRLEGKATPEQAQAIEALRSSGALAHLEEQALDSTLFNLPGQSTTVAEKQAALAALNEGKDAAISSRATDITSPGEMWRQVQPRLVRYGMPVAAGAVGALTGGDPSDSFVRGAAGLALGGIAGGKAGAAAAIGNSMRPAAHALLRMARHPAVETALAKPFARFADSALPTAARTAAGEAGAAAAPVSLVRYVSDIARSEPSALGQWAGYFPPNATEDEHAVTDYTLAQTDPGYQRHRRELAERAEKGLQ